MGSSIGYYFYIISSHERKIITPNYRKRGLHFTLYIFVLLKMERIQCPHEKTDVLHERVLRKNIYCRRSA